MQIKNDTSMVPTSFQEKPFSISEKMKRKKARQVAKINAITIKSIEQMIPSWVNAKLAEEKGGIFEINLEKLGYNKLLSNGKVSKKLKITTPYASASAVEKINAAGGEILGMAKKEKPAEQPKAEQKQKEE